MDYVYFYGSSVRMGHKVYIIPILLITDMLTFVDGDVQKEEYVSSD